MRPKNIEPYRIVASCMQVKRAHRAWHLALAAGRTLRVPFGMIGRELVVSGLVCASQQPVFFDGVQFYIRVSGEASGTSYKFDFGVTSIADSYLFNFRTWSIQETVEA